MKKRRDKDGSFEDKGVSTVQQNVKKTAVTPFSEESISDDSQLLSVIELDSYSYRFQDLIRLLSIQESQLRREFELQGIHYPLFVSWPRTEITNEQSLAPSSSADITCLGDYLKKERAQAQANKKSARLLVIPYPLISLSNNQKTSSWVLLVVQINKEGVIKELRYVDSLQKNESTTLFPEEIIVSIRSAYGPDLVPALHRWEYFLQKENSSHNSGVLWLENAVWVIRSLQLRTSARSRGWMLMWDYHKDIWQLEYSPIMDQKAITALRKQHAVCLQYGACHQQETSVRTFGIEIFFSSCQEVSCVTSGNHFSAEKAGVKGLTSVFFSFLSLSDLLQLRLTCSAYRDLVGRVKVKEVLPSFLRDDSLESKSLWSLLFEAPKGHSIDEILFCFAQEEMSLNLCSATDRVLQEWEGWYQKISLLLFSRRRAKKIRLLGSLYEGRVADAMCLMLEDLQHRVPPQSFSTIFNQLFKEAQWFRRDCPGLGNKDNILSQDELHLQRWNHFLAEVVRLEKFIAAFLLFYKIVSTPNRTSFFSSFLTNENFYPRRLSKVFYINMACYFLFSQSFLEGFVAKILFTNPKIVRSLIGCSQEDEMILCQLVLDDGLGKRGFTKRKFRQTTPVYWLKYLSGLHNEKLRWSLVRRESIKRRAGKKINIAHLPELELLLDRRSFGEAAAIYSQLHSIIKRYEERTFLVNRLKEVNNIREVLLKNPYLLDPSYSHLWIRAAEFFPFLQKIYRYETERKEEEHSVFNSLSSSWRCQLIEIQGSALEFEEFFYNQTRRAYAFLKAMDADDLDRIYTLFKGVKNSCLAIFLQVLLSSSVQSEEDASENRGQKDNIRKCYDLNHCADDFGVIESSPSLSSGLSCCLRSQSTPKEERRKGGLIPMTPVSHSSVSLLAAEWTRKQKWAAVAVVLFFLLGLGFCFMGLGLVVSGPSILAAVKLYCVMKFNLIHLKTLFFCLGGFSLFLGGLGIKALRSSCRQSTIDLPAALTVGFFKKQRDQSSSSASIETTFADTDSPKIDNFKQNEAKFNGKAEFVY